MSPVSRPELGARWHRRLLHRSRDGNRELSDLVECALVLSIGAEVVPRFDLFEGSFRPRVDGVEEADEEVHRQGADVDLILGDRDPFEELLFDLSRETEHLPCVVSYLIEGCEDLLLAAEGG